MHLRPDQLQRAGERRPDRRREVGARLGARGLDLDRDGGRGERAEAGRDVDEQVDADVAGDRAPHRCLHLVGRAGGHGDRAALDRPRHSAPVDRTHQHERARPQVLEPLHDRHRAVGELLDEYAGAEVLRRQALDGEAPRVKVALEQLGHPADEDGVHARARAVSRPRRRSRC